MEKVLLLAVNLIFFVVADVWLWFGFVESTALLDMAELLSAHGK